MIMVSRGETDALAVLYDRHSPIAFALARRMLRDEETASEVIQDAFLNVWRGSATFRPERGRFAAWLMSVVRHLAIDELRRRRSKPKANPIDTSSITSKDKDTSGDDGMWGKLVNHEIRSALSKLPDQQRQVIELAYFQGFTQQEISDHTGDSLGTVKTRVRLGLQKLKEFLYP